VLLCFVALLLALPAVSPAQDEEEDDGFTTDFFIEDCSFSDRGANNFWSLNPGDQSVLEGEEDGEELEVIINVLHQTELISFVTEYGVPMTVRSEETSARF
jgi:hypothetical protein